MEGPKSTPGSSWGIVPTWTATLWANQGTHQDSRHSPPCSLSISRPLGFAFLRLFARLLGLSYLLLLDRIAFSQGWSTCVMQITQGGGKPRKGAFRWFLLCFTDHLHPYSLPLGQLSVDWTPAFSCREAHNKPPSPPTPNSHPFRVLNWCHWGLQNPPRFRQAAHFMLVKMEMTTFSCLPCPRISKHPSSRKSQTQRKQRASYQATSFVGLHPWVLNMLADTQAFWNA